MRNKIIVSLDCQSLGVADALTMSLKSGSAVAYPLAALNTPAIKQRYEEDLKTADYILTSANSSSTPHPGCKVLKLPLLIYPGFFPDLCSLRDNDGRYYTQEKYHSGIVYICYSLGLTKDACVRHFSEEVFRALEFEKSHKNSLALIRNRLGGTFLERFSEQLTGHLNTVGNFMYTDTHPTSTAHLIYAQYILDALGLKYYKNPPLPRDYLDYFKWAYYNYSVLKSPRIRNYFWILKNGVQLRTVEDFVDYYYSLYERNNVSKDFIPSNRLNINFSIIKSLCTPI